MSEAIGTNVYALNVSEDADRFEVSRARKEAYLEWLALPKEERKPSTKKAVAEQLGISVVQLLQYEKDPWLRDELNKRLRASFRVDRLSTVFERLYETATDVDSPRQVSAARTLLEWADRAAPVEHESLAGYSVDELEAAFKELKLRRHGSQTA